MSPLNRFFIPRKFRMKTLLGILQLLRTGLWVTPVDLGDAYLLIPGRPQDQRYLCFVPVRGHALRVLHGTEDLHPGLQALTAFTSEG